MLSIVDDGLNGMLGIGLDQFGCEDDMREVMRGCTRGVARDVMS